VCVCVHTALIYQGSYDISRVRVCVCVHTALIYEGSYDISRVLIQCGYRRYLSIRRVYLYTPTRTNIYLYTPTRTNSVDIAGIYVYIYIDTHGYKHTYKHTHTYIHKRTHRAWAAHAALAVVDCTAGPCLIHRHYSIQYGSL